MDRTLAVMRLDDASGKPLAALVNFSGHPTSVPGQTLKFSADYVGAMKAAIEHDFGGTALFMQGASGDLTINKGSNADHVAFFPELVANIVDEYADGIRPRLTVAMLNGGFVKLPNGTTTTRHVVMGVCEARDGASSSSPATTATTWASTVCGRR